MFLKKTISNKRKDMEFDSGNAKKICKLNSITKI